eukprot:GAHX01001262.1.p1 GENE.GAHX01001262.1~~GAHX01001262.1.p1  ORF type:complete len:290 (+),score=78.54 GAHX01001262.1:52-921(+)
MQQDAPIIDINEITKITDNINCVNMLESINTHSSTNNKAEAFKLFKNHIQTKEHASRLLSETILIQKALIADLKSEIKAKIANMSSNTNSNPNPQTQKEPKEVKMSKLNISAENQNINSNNNNNKKKESAVKDTNNNGTKKAKIKTTKTNNEKTNTTKTNTEHSSSIFINKMTQNEFITIPKYQIGKVTINDVNAFIEEFNSLINIKHNILGKHYTKLNMEEKSKLNVIKEQMKTFNFKIKLFLTGNELKDTKFCRQDKKGRIISSILKMKKMIFIDKKESMMFYSINK